MKQLKLQRLPWNILQLSGSESFRGSAMKVAVEVSTEASEEHHLLPLASAYFHRL